VSSGDARMRFGQLMRGPRRLMVLFLAVTIVSAAALGWVSWKLFEQDSELERQRMADRLEGAAGRSQSDQSTSGTGQTSRAIETPSRRPRCGCPIRALHA
jgi:peptidoglycan/LPS O-acetylase OafA/YrhL